MNNYIVDIKNFHEFDEAKNLNSYDELIKFFQKFDRDYYDTRFIHNHIHHIIPRSEGGSDEKNNLVCLPYRYHIKAHYLRGKEQEAKNDLFNAYKNYKSVRYSIRDSSLPITVQDLELKLNYVCESLQREKELKKYVKGIWISKGSECIQIYEQDYKIMKEDGWERKRVFNSPSGKVWTTDGTKNIYVKKESLEKYLIDNPSFKKGFTARITKSRASYSTLNTKWMNKDGINKAIKKEDVDKFLNEGWSLGHTKFSFKKGWKWSKQYHWYTNGEKSILAKECPDGFILGRQAQKRKVPDKRRGRHWYNNGKTSKMLSSCPEGWEEGKL